MKLEPSDLGDLKPVIRLIVAEVLEQAVGELDRIAYTEAEAAAKLGIAKHVLRDCRRRGEIKGRLAGKKTVYSRAELIRFIGEHA